MIVQEATKKKGEYLEALKREIFPGASILVRGEVKPGVWLLIGPPKVGKSAFCRRFLEDRILEGTACIYILTKFPPKDLQNEILRKNPLLKSYLRRRLKIIDCYSWRLGSGGDLTLSDPANLNELNMLIQKAERSIGRKKDYAIILNSISTLALEAGPFPTIKFLQALVGRLKSINSFGLFVLEDGIHHESFVNTLKFIFDGIFEMKFEERSDGIRKMFRIFSLPEEADCITQWLDISEILK